MSQAPEATHTWTLLLDHFPWWPFVALVVAVSALFMFRSALHGFIANWKKIGVGPFSAEAPATVGRQNDGSAEMLVPTLPGKNNRLIPDTAAIRETEEQIRSGLITAYGSSLPAQIDGLINALAHARLAQRWETTFRIIFGSQIAILERMNASIQGVTEAEVKEHFDKWQKVRPILKDIRFPDWMSFLLNEKLVLIKDGKYMITTGGHEFLSWMIRARLSNNRIG